ncbi:MAG: penicillin-binding protein 2 [Campylobacterales bacterium]|nr:penicillin-binding protein 2 [Campylobacterales bacterium]
MNETNIKSYEPQNNVNKIAVVFVFILIGFLIFISAISYTTTSDRKLPSTHTKKVDVAQRGSILSYDNFTLSSSQKLYKASIHTKTIDPDKKELFINLFSIYSGIDKDEIRGKINSANGFVVLSQELDAKKAKILKELSYKLYAHKVFVPYEDTKNGRVITYGLSIAESGEQRTFLHDDLLTPLIGYVNKIQKDRIDSIVGVKGIEKYYNDKLEPFQDEYIHASRDVGSTPILNKDAIIKDKVDGLDVYLNISLKLQKYIETILNRYKEELEAKEVLVCVIESNSGKVLSMATSNRYNPNSIKKDDYPNLNVKAIEYPFEPGSVLKPVIFSILLDKNLIKPHELVNGYGGKYKLKNKIITDEHKFDWMSAEDVIIHSSNIGMAQISQRLHEADYYQKLLDFGFSKPTGIDVAYEKGGVLPTITQLRDEIYKATVSYGYGLKATFMQVLMAYNVFNNDGLIVVPKVVNKLKYKDMRTYPVKTETKERIIDITTARKMLQIFKKTVEKGTGVATNIPGLFIGGKTGTAHIAVGGKYENIYNSSFFGFANDDKHRYTIGVTVFEPQGKYFASQTAVPVFRDIVLKMIELGYLKQNIKE